MSHQWLSRSPRARRHRDSCPNDLVKRNLDVETLFDLRCLAIDPSVLHKTCHVESVNLMVQVAERSAVVVKRRSEKKLRCPAGIVLPAVPSWCGEVYSPQKAEVAFFLTGVARKLRFQCSGRVLMLLDR